MTRAHKSEATKTPAFILKPHHERILDAIYRYHFLTVEQITRLLYSKGTISTVRAFLRDLTQAGYITSIYLPRPTPTGSQPKIYTLDNEGLAYFKRRGADIKRFHHAADDEKSLLFLRHTLAVNDFLIAAAMLHKLYPAITLHTFLHERVLKRQELIKVSFEKLTADGKHVLDRDERPIMETVRLIPDAFVDIRITQPNEEGQSKTYRFCLLLELDRATIEEKNFKRKVRGLLTFAKSGESLTRFGAKLPTIAFANAVGGQKRREQLREWTEAELRKTKEPHFWSQMFMFSDLPDGEIDAEALFLSPVWYTPFKDKPAVLMEVGSR